MTWVLDAMKADAPLLHDDVYTDEMGKRGDKPSNIAKHLHFEQGDVDAAFAKADVVIEREFQHGQRAPGLHRAARRHGAVERTTAI